MKKVLVLDDDTDILQLVNLILTRDGLKVQTISRWQEIGEVIREFAANIEFQKSIDECQAQGFIAKPFELKTLVNTIKELI